MRAPVRSFGGRACDWSSRLRPGSPARATAITPHLDRSVTIDFSGQPGQNYLVQAATNLSVNSWASIGTNAADPDGAWSFTDPYAANGPARFYRPALSGADL